MFYNGWFLIFLSFGDVNCWFIVVGAEIQFVVVVLNFFKVGVVVIVLFEVVWSYVSEY